jgi:aminoglycoside phosphotransferase (APT) family kinase protein
MERVKGIILRAWAPKTLDLSPPVMRNLSKSFAENLAEIHRLDYQVAGLGDLGQPHGYVTRQIDGWTRRYFAARTDDVKEVERLATWLCANLRTESEYSALIHNDYKYDNLVLAADDLSRVIAVLDWEMATIGDPLMDLGTTLGYWVESQDTDEWQQFGFGLTNLPGNLSRRELVEYYAQCTGWNVSDAVFYYAFGLLKIAVIVQQIYSRYRGGLTRDSRFSNLGLVVRACGIQAHLAIEKQRIDSLG